MDEYSRLQQEMELSLKAAEDEQQVSIELVEPSVDEVLNKLYHTLTPFKILAAVYADTEIQNQSVEEVSQIQEESLTTNQATAEVETQVHKNASMRNKCAEFISQGWKMIKEGSIQPHVTFNKASFVRLNHATPEEIFWKVFDEDVLQTLQV